MAGAWAQGDLSPCAVASPAGQLHSDSCPRLWERAFQETGSGDCHSFKVRVSKLAPRRFCKILLIKAVTEPAQIRAWGHRSHYWMGHGLHLSKGKVPKHVGVAQFLVIILGGPSQHSEPKSVSWSLHCFLNSIGVHLQLMYVCVGGDVGSLSSNTLTLKIIAYQIVTGELWFLRCPCQGEFSWL